ncbi:MAG: carboxypeptidase regulatory-like domain-containing protein [Candidatus Competibacter sp.]
MAMALVLGGGVLQSAGAQQTVGAPPTDSADSPPRYQEPAPGTPAPLPRPNPHTGSESAAPPSPSPDAVAGPDGSPPSPRIHSDRGIRYVSGGVGEGERAELDALSNQFNLRLLFAMQGSGEYLSAVRVTILDARGGTVLTAESKGPWFFAQLAPGEYTVGKRSPPSPGNG